MKKIILFFVFCLSISMLKAQIPLCSGKGPILDTYGERYDMTIMKNGESEFTAYCSPVTFGKKNIHHAVVTYDKTENTISTQQLILPANTFRLVATDNGDSYFVTYSRYPDKKNYEYVTSIIPKNQSETEVNLTQRLAFETGRYGYVKSYVATSQNGKYNAVFLINISKYNRANEIHLFVYDEKGQEIVYRKFTFAVEDHFAVADFKVSDEGEAIFLFQLGEEKADALQAHKLQILTYKDNEFGANYSIDFPDEVVNSAKMCLLKNGNIFIGGYTAASAEDEETGYFATSYKPTEQAFEPIHSYEIIEKKQPGKRSLSSTPAPLHMFCTDVLELENGNVMMLGELTAQLFVQNVSGGFVSSGYLHYSNQIGYETFKSDGTCLTDDNFQMIYRKAKKVVPFSCSMSNEVVSPKYSAIGLSHSAFVKGNNVYVLFTDHEENLLTHDDSAPIANLNLQRETSCLLMAKLNATDEPEYQLVYQAGEDRKTMNKMWLFDGKNVYFGSNNNKMYWLDHFQLPKE